MYEVKVMSNFSAAHRLKGYKGKCENLHGHNWRVELIVSSKTLDKSGLLVDFRVLKERLNNIIERLDHTNLNELPQFTKKNPTSENIAKFIFDMLKKDAVSPQGISVWESDNTSATYSEP